MRKIMAAAIVLMLAGATSWALVGLEDVNFDGSLEINGNSANNETDYDSATAGANDHRGGANTRVSVGMNATVTENVKARIALWRTGRQYGTGATNVAGEEGMWDIENAYIDLGEHFTLSNIRIGRQFAGTRNDLVWSIMPRMDDSLTVQAIDGLNVDAKYLDDKLAVNFFTGKTAEDDGLANTDSDDTTGDVNLNNLEASYNGLIPDGAIRVGYLWGKDSNTNATADDNSLQIARIGVTGGLMEKALTYRAEYLQNMGQLDNGGTTDNLDYKGTAIDLGVGYNLSETKIGGLGFALNLLMASGDKEANNDDKSFHDFSTLGTASSDRYYGEILGKDNTFGGTAGLDTGVEGQGVQIIHLGATWTPKMWEKGTVSLDYINEKYAEDTWNGASIKDDIGDEIDLTVGYKPAETVKLDVGYAMLAPGDALTGGGAAKDDDVTKLFGRISINWGGAE